MKYDWPGAAYYSDQYIFLLTNAINYRKLLLKIINKRIVSDTIRSEDRERQNLALHRRNVLN